MFARISSMFGGPDNSSSRSASPSQSMFSGGSNPSNDSSSQSQNSEHYQIDNSGSVLEKIAKLYAERLMSDIVLIVGKQEYAAHRLILCASSDVFQVMLMNPEWNESREQRIILQEAPECIEVFDQYLRYLYTGQLKVSHATVLPILALADKYNVKDLIMICSNYMQSNIVSATRHNCFISWLQYSLLCGHTRMAKAFMNHFKWNFEQVAKSDDFAYCDIELIITVLSHNDLVVLDEMTLFSYVVKWLHHQEDRLLSTTATTPSSHPPADSSPCPLTTSPFLPTFAQPSYHSNHGSRRVSTCSSNDPCDQMEHLTYEVMRYVRFPMITRKQLADLLLVPLIIKYKEFFVTRMAIGMSFHSGHWDRVREIISEPDPSNHLLFTPRLYTVDQWGSGLSVDNMPAFPPYHTRTLVFSTPASAAELENEEQQLEWIVEVYPKGVWFRKFFLIIWQGTVEVPEAVLRTVRLSVTARDAEYARVRISALIYGKQNDIEHIIKVITTRHIFTADDNLLNIDDFLPFDELNDSELGEKYLLDPCNALRIHVVISPLMVPSMHS